MYFQHQLGKMVGINTLWLVISPFSGGIIGGPVLQNLGWRWSQWISGIIMGVALAGYIFLVPEVTSAFFHILVSDRRLIWVCRAYMSEKKALLIRLYGVFENPTADTNTLSYLFSPDHSPCFSIPLYCFLVYGKIQNSPKHKPCLISSRFGIAYMVHVGITSNISLIFEGKQFHFSIIQAGLSFFSGLIGAFTGELFAGPVVDYLAKRSLKTGAVWVPELRFRAIWLGLFMMPVSLPTQEI
jgi:MFS family permease